MGRTKTKVSEHLLDKGPYYVDRSGALFFQTSMRGGEGFETDPIANHAPIAVRCVRWTDGFSYTEKVEFRTIREKKLSQPVEVDRKTILSTTPHILFDMACRIIPGRGHVSRYSEFMQIQCETVPTITKYAHTGWHVTEDGKRVFLNGDYSVCADGLTDDFTVELDPDLSHFRFLKIDDPDEDCIRTVWEGFKGIMPSEKSIPLIAYTLLTPLNEMLRSLGMEPCFSLYIVGKTGCYKSSIAKLLLNFFGSFSYSDSAPSSFNATKSSVERKMGVCADITLLMDDRRPSQTADRASYETMEKYSSSAIGDRAFRGRLNADGSAKKSFIPRSNLIVTAEEAFQNIGSSSIARAVTVEFEKDTVDFEKMCEVQEKAQHLNRFMQLFLQWVIREYDSIKKECPKLLKSFREKYANAGHARLATAFSQLLLGYYCFLMFLKDRRVIDQHTVDKEMGLANDSFNEMCQHQNKLIEGDSPVQMFLDAIREMVTTRSTTIARLREHKAFYGDSYKADSTIGYKDENYYFFVPLSTYNAVCEFYRRSDYSFPASRISLQKELLRQGVVIPEKSGGRIRADGRITIDDKQVRCWRIPVNYINKPEEVVKGE